MAITASLGASKASQALLALLHQLAFFEKSLEFESNRSAMLMAACCAWLLRRM